MAVPTIADFERNEFHSTGDILSLSDPAKVLVAMNDSSPLEPISPADLTPRPPEGATAAQCVEMWIDLMNACDAFLLARLRREVGPEGDVMAAYREWYRKDREEHDRALFRMLERLDRVSE